MQDLSPSDKVYLQSFKKNKGSLDADFNNYISNHGLENSVKRRIVRKYRALKDDFSTLKHRFPSDFVEIIEGYFLKHDGWVSDFEKELKQASEAVTTDFENLQYTEGKYKRVGEATVKN